jgi:hypothetical protein
MSSHEVWKYREFVLASGNKAYKNGIAAIDLSSGKVVPGQAGTDLFVFGKFAETVDATSADKVVTVNFDREVVVEWLANDTVSAVASTDVGSLCYQKDDQTVTASASGNSIAGRVWAVSTADGVAVEKLQSTPAAPANLDSLPLLEADPGAFVSNDLVIGDNPDSGSVYEIPDTSANSTVTLPATAEEGCELTFVADGTHNDNTVQYRDATGPVNLTTALAASKRHMVKAVFLNSKWRAIAYVSP